MLKGIKIRNGQTCDAYGRKFSFDLAALRKQWAKADAHKQKRTGNPRAIGEIAHAHVSPSVKLI